MSVIITVDSLAANANLGPGGRQIATAFQLSADRPALVMYTVRIVGAATANLTGGRIELRSDASNPPTTVRCQARSVWKVTGTLTTMQQEQDSVLTYIVPKGHFVNLVSTTENGNLTYSIITQTEVIL